jgi:hypothetical protein
MFEKVNLRKGLMARVERKYCDNGDAIIEKKELSLAPMKKSSVSLLKELSISNNSKPLTRFSIGKRVGRVR